MMRNAKARKIALDASEREFIRRGNRIDLIWTIVSLVLLALAFLSYAASVR
jgi:hypothetical protein